jgi:hypothetical protein
MTVIHRVMNERVLGTFGVFVYPVDGAIFE